MLSRSQFGRISVTVEKTGKAAGVPAAFLREYHVVAKHKAVRYASNVWDGRDARDARGDVRPEEVAARVIEELFAATDAEGYVADAMGEATGQKALALGERAKKTVAAARRMGYAVVETACEDARKRGLL